MLPMTHVYRSDTQNTSGPRLGSCPSSLWFADRKLGQDPKKAFVESRDIENRNSADEFWQKDKR